MTSEAEDHGSRLLLGDPGTASKSRPSPRGAPAPLTAPSDGEHGARPLAQPQAEVEQRNQAEVVQRRLLAPGSAERCPATQ